MYFFFEDGEVRGDGSSRVVRVGTHALTAASKATLRGRLRQHRGHLADRDPGSGSHRASVFRRHARAALIQRDGRPPELLASWLDRHGPHPGRASQLGNRGRDGGQPSYRGDAGALAQRPGPRHRGYIERNSIALTSSWPPARTRPAPAGLGTRPSPARSASRGLWNVQHVTQPCHPGFLPTLQRLIQLHR